MPGRTVFSNPAPHTPAISRLQPRLRPPGISKSRLRCITFTLVLCCLPCMAAFIRAVAPLRSRRLTEAPRVLSGVGYGGRWVGYGAAVATASSLVPEIDGPTMGSFLAIIAVNALYLTRKIGRYLVSAVPCFVSRALFRMYRGQFPHPAPTGLCHHLAPCRLQLLACGSSCTDTVTGTCWSRPHTS